MKHPPSLSGAHGASLLEAVDHRALATGDPGSANLDLFAATKGTGA